METLAHAPPRAAKEGLSMAVPILKIEFTLPTWLADYTTSVSCIPELEDRVDFVIEASRRNVQEKTGGPFAAAVFEADSGKLLSLGVNLVEREGLSFLHGEMVALALAQRTLGTFDLGAPGLPAHELVSSTEPCAMCFGALPWSGIRRLVTAARDEDARSIGFDEGPKLVDWRAALQLRGIQVLCDIHREKAVAVLQEYARNGGLIYNARSG